MTIDPKPNTIAFFLIVMAVSLTTFLFAESRNDPSLRIAMLVSATGTVAAILAIASTLLVGKDVTKPRDPADMPPNTATVDTTTTTIKTGPVDPNVPK